jgi:AhpD family alkylhydroperoxidase
MSSRVPARKPVEYQDASPAVRAVFDDIKKSRNVPDVNNFWKYLAHDPVTLKRTWESVKEVMAPGALDPLTKEMIYLAVSVSNGCGYCIASHTAAARKAGMTDAMFGEVMAVTGMANETNRLANGPASRPGRGLLQTVSLTVAGLQAPGSQVGSQAGCCPRPWSKAMATAGAPSNPRRSWPGWLLQAGRSPCWCCHSGCG